MHRQDPGPLKDKGDIDRLQQNVANEKARVQRGANFFSSPRWRDIRASVAWVEIAMGRILKFTFRRTPLGAALPGPIALYVN